MARQRSPSLTDGEARLMTVLWERTSATVADIVAALEPQGPVNYSTVQTLLRILEKKGYVEHHKAGRAFVYSPVVDQQQARRRALSHLLARCSTDRPACSCSTCSSTRRIAPDELKRLKQMLDSGRVGGSVEAIVNWIWQGVALTAVATLGLHALAAPQRHDPVPALVGGDGAGPAVAAGAAIRDLGAARMSAPRAVAALAPVPLPALPIWPVFAAVGVWLAWVAVSLARVMTSFAALLLARRARRRLPASAGSAR